MRLSLRFIVPLLLALAAIAYGNELEGVLLTGDGQQASRGGIIVGYEDAHELASLKRHHLGDSLKIRDSWRFIM